LGRAYSLGPIWSSRRRIAGAEFAHDVVVVAVVVEKYCPEIVVAVRRRSESMSHNTYWKEHGVEILEWKGAGNTALLRPSLVSLAEGG
jgi:hypothetical protein